MKALAIIIIVLSMGDLAIDHGAGLRAVGNGAAAFAHAVHRSFAESLFAD